MWRRHSHLKFNFGQTRIFKCLFFQIGFANQGLRSSCSLQKEQRVGMSSVSVRMESVGGIFRTEPHQDGRTNRAAVVRTAVPLNGAFLPITSHAERWLIYNVVLEEVLSSLGKWFKQSQRYVCMKTTRLLLCLVFYWYLTDNDVFKNQKSTILPQ